MESTREQDEVVKISAYSDKEPEQAQEDLVTTTAMMTTTTTTSSSNKIKSLHALHNQTRTGWLQSLSLLLNAGLMIYAHVGLSAVFVSNQQRVDTTSSNIIDVESSLDENTTASSNVFSNLPCTNDNDWNLWNYQGGAAKKSDQSNYCAREYQGNGCLISAECAIACFVETYGYTAECSACFAAVPVCSLIYGCAGTCSSDSNSKACATCLIPCNEQFATCSGLPEVPLGGWNNDTTSNDEGEDGSSDVTLNKTIVSSFLDNDQVCAAQQEDVDPNDVDEYYVVYELLFFDAVKTAWQGNAQGLAIVIVLFSGIWPYAKNVLLMVAWYAPLTARRRSQLLKWLRRLGKYTLVDVYVVIVLMVGVMVQMNVANGTPLVIRGEPRGAILAFLFATLWEFVHVEWMSHVHQQYLAKAAAAAIDTQPSADAYNDEERRGTDTNTSPRSPWMADALQFAPVSADQTPRTCGSRIVGRVVLAILVVATLALFVAGSVLELVRFTATRTGEPAGCAQSYHLYSLGTVLLSDFFLETNTAVGATVILFVAYLMCILVLPLAVHTVHAIVCLGNVQSRKLCIGADQCWTFASVEILLLGVYMVQYKFSNLMAQLAGSEGTQFFAMEATLGPGFWMLLAYSVVAGVLHYLFNSAVMEYYDVDPYYQIDGICTRVCDCVLRAGDGKKDNKTEDGTETQGV